MDWSDEGDTTCLGLIPGKVQKLPDRSGLKVPHMGWNQVWQRVDHPIFEGIADGSDFYFVHSYYPSPADDAVVIGETEYGVRFASVLARENLVATQFHPEKSGEAGLRFYKNFLELAFES
jgi:glutamine amidotransferase